VEIVIAVLGAEVTVVDVVIHVGIEEEAEVVAEMGPAFAVDTRPYRPDYRHDEEAFDCLGHIRGVAL